MTTKLDLYNDALLILGERSLASLSENREPRRALDQAYPSLVRYCLEQGHWKFAQRTVLLQADVGVTPAFGYQFAFKKPDDWVSTSKVCSDEYFNTPLLSYADENGWWYSSLDEIYVSYTSDAADAGGNLANWPESFTEFAYSRLAYKTAFRITNSGEKEERARLLTDNAMSRAKSKDAMQGPTVFPPVGRWVSARTNNRNRERGNLNRLIG